MFFFLLSLLFWGTVIFFGVLFVRAMFNDYTMPPQRPLPPPPPSEWRVNAQGKCEVRTAKGWVPYA